jgi:hypothetical protein
VNAALRSFLNRYRDAGPPYATSRDLYNELRAVTPDSVQSLLVDLFETITLTVSRKPESVGVDPYNNLIQRVNDGKVVELDELRTTPWTAELLMSQSTGWSLLRSTMVGSHADRAPSR